MYRCDWSNIMPKFFGLQVLLRGKGIKLVCPAHRVIQWYMRYVGFKPQTLRNAKWNYHCSGPLELYLYIQICTVLAKFLVLMFLYQIYRTQNKKKELEERTYTGCLINAQETWTSSKWSQGTTEDRCWTSPWLLGYSTVKLKEGWNEEEHVKKKRERIAAYHTRKRKCQLGRRC